MAFDHENSNYETNENIKMWQSHMEETIERLEARVLTLEGRHSSREEKMKAIQDKRLKIKYDRQRTRHNRNATESEETTFPSFDEWRATRAKKARPVSTS